MKAEDKRISDFTDDEVIIYQRGYRHGSEAEADISFEAGKMEVVEFLKEKTIKAYGGNRIILAEDYKTITKR
ncbi:hypothetical protein LCGC14_0922480 [marine sediment metagenome]|uniref:Uncharacterized protein n=1 Tax=marine sediment metagenome TaxID=412755 RepID=A0A0F9RWV7_9ZZZZ